MAATGKKSKKTKWIPASVTNFIADTTVIPATNNWADSVDEEPSNNYPSYASSRTRQHVLPSASRAARGDLGVDDESIPRRPPYIAHISNLPYDVDESAIMELFAGLKINNLRLPREGDRLKGFGNVDFEDRESLVSAMNMPDLTVGGRRIRIEVSNQDNERRMGRNNRPDRDREYDPERTMGDWRSGPRAVPDSSSRARPMERDGMRDRERDRERESSADNKPGAWRDAERAEPPRQPYGGRDSYGRDRERERGYGGRDGFRTAERDGGFGRESRGFGSRGFGDRDPPREADSKPRERPKLNLLPRTVPREIETPTKPADGAPLEKAEKPAPKPVSAEKVFGAAKPVDTAAKEREIEERLRKQEEESRRSTEEKDRWTRRNDHSDDRRGGARRDDRDRGYRNYNKDRRDYSRDNKDKRDYSKDDRDRNDYSRDDRDRRDYKDERDRRESYDRDRRNRDDRDRDDRNRQDRDDSRRRDGEDRNEADRRDSHDRDRRDDKYDRPDSRDGDRPKREHSRERRSPSPEREQQNGRESRSRDRRDADDRPLPKLKEQEKPNFVASNKFSFLEDADDISD